MICCFLLTNLLVIYFAKTKIPTPTKKNRISLTEDTLVLMPCEAGNKLKNCTQIWPKKLVFFFEDYGVAADVKFIEMVKKNCAIRQRRLWKPLCCDLLSRIILKFTLRAVRHVVPRPLNEKVSCLFTVRQTNCETTAGIVQKKKN